MDKKKLPRKTWVQTIVHGPAVITILHHKKYGVCKGVAICDPADTFDDTFGKDLSGARADVKCIGREIRAFEKELDRRAEEFNILFGKYTEAMLRKSVAESKVDELLRSRD